jgi:hypothetical protein
LRARRRPLRASVAVAGVVVALAARARGQILVENAGPISPETPALQSRLEFGLAENATDLRLVETGIFSPHASMDFALAVPLALRSIDLPGQEGALSGLGDASLRWKQMLWRTDDVMRSTRFAALAGVELPTGDSDEEIDGAEAPRKLQLGSGSFDLYGGPLFTHIVDRHRFAAELIGRANGVHDGFRLQNSVRAGLAWWYRVAPARLELAGEKTEIRAVLELTSTFYGESRQDGHGLDDDGNLTWIAPGIQIYPSTRCLLEANVQFPIVETMDDLFGDRKLAALLTFKVLF